MEGAGGGGVDCTMAALNKLAEPNAGLGYSLVLLNIVFDVS